MRRSLSDKIRAKVFADAGGVCHICGAKICAGEWWEVEHVIPLAMGGADDLSNMRPAHGGCHKEKTRDDAGRVAKAKRVQAKHIGAHRPRRRINPTAQRQKDIPLSEKSDWRSRKDAWLNRE